jgi:enoyl reductase-like protein
MPLQPLRPPESPLQPKSSQQLACAIQSDAVCVKIERIDDRIEEMLNRIHQYHIESIERAAALDATLAKQAANLSEHAAAERGYAQVVADLKAAFFGNGKPSHELRIDRLEQWRSRLKFVLTSVAVPILVYGVYAMIQEWLR